MVAKTLVTLFAFVLGQPAMAVEIMIGPHHPQIIINRPDLEVESIALNPLCAQNRDEPYQTCEDFRVNGDPTGYLEFKSTGQNEVTIPELRIQFSGRANEFFCLGFKVFFKGIPNQKDSKIYLDLDDRYSILSYCSVPNLPVWIAQNPRWTHKRVYSPELFSEVLAGPILLHLIPKH